MRRPGEQAAIVIKSKAPTIEDQLILSANHVDIGDAGRIFLCTFLEECFALSAFVCLKRRGVDIDNELRALSRLRGNWPIGIPDIFTNINAETQTVQLKNRGSFPWRKVAIFIKNTVVRQTPLMVGEHMLSFVNNGGGIVEMVFYLINKTDHEHQTRTFLNDLRECATVFLDKLLFVQEVFRGVAANDHFRKSDKIGLPMRSSSDRLNDFFCVTGKIPNYRIELSQCNAKCRDWRFHLMRSSLNKKMASSPMEKTPLSSYA